MEKVEIDITRAFIDGGTYKLYIQSYLHDDLANKESIEVKYKDELNKDYKPGQNFVCFEVANPNWVGFKGVLAVDLWQGILLNIRGYEMSGNKIEDFIRNPHKYKIQFSETSDDDTLKEMMVDSGMITEDEWKEHKVEPINYNTGVILAVYPETLNVRFGAWFKYMPEGSYHYRELTIPLSKLFNTYFMKILGGMYYDEPVFDPIRMKEKEKK